MGGKIVSNLPVLFHAMMMPNVVPIKNAIIIEIPAKKIVQPSPLPMISETGAGNKLSKFPSRLLEYFLNRKNIE